jgi:aryl-alcohol dehydrogenase-like predicted oxidoreductase
LARGLLARSAASSEERATTRGRSDPFRDSLYKEELDVPVIDRLGEVAEEAGVPPAQIALAWLLHKPGVTAPIVGATKLEHLEDALAAEELSLTEDQVARLEEPYVPHLVSGIDL